MQGGERAPAAATAKQHSLLSRAHFKEVARDGKEAQRRYIESALKLGETVIDRTPGKLAGVLYAPDKEELSRAIRGVLKPKHESADKILGHIEEYPQWIGVVAPGFWAMGARQFIVISEAVFGSLSHFRSMPEMLALLGHENRHVLDAHDGIRYGKEKVRGSYNYSTKFFKSLVEMRAYGEELELVRSRGLKVSMLHWSVTLHCFKENADSLKASVENEPAALPPCAPEAATVLELQTKETQSLTWKRDYDFYNKLIEKASRNG
ncbi:MAG: hypothetical protein KGI04_03325 [Candidatus Micrarchaeota archaeon]|nr:hypothetical protein [Candidatus Micrarchaeota archaeon]